MRDSRECTSRLVRPVGRAYVVSAVRSRFLAFDLGAESGRAMLGELHAGAITLKEVCRFANEPVRQNSSVRWDILCFWLEITCGFDCLLLGNLAGIGVDTWGCD